MNADPYAPSVLILSNLIRFARRQAADPSPFRGAASGTARPAPHGMPLRRYWCLRVVFLAQIAPHTAKGLRTRADAFRRYCATMTPTTL